MTEDIDDIVKNVIRKMSSKKQDEQLLIYQCWERVVSEQDRRHCCLAGITGATLVVHVDCSTRLYQFNLKKKKILDAIRKMIPEIQKLYFKIGKVQ